MYSHFLSLFDAATTQQIVEFRIHKILFCARGRLDTNEKDCFAFTYLHGSSQDTTVYQCHAFRCNVPEAVSSIIIINIMNIIMHLLIIVSN